jgi:UDP-N-acetylmuramoyl-L-alanyl-D-glutamate--2,6-diaminopimelate ligase
MSMPAELIRPHVTLAQLLKGFAGAPGIHIHGLSSDSRKLAPGDVFIALDGENAHGLDYLGQAVEAGVAAVLFDPAMATVDPRDYEFPLVPLGDLRKRVGDIANRWYGDPSSRMTVTGVTGTNGKTTVAFLIAQCRQLLHDRAAYIGTLGSGIDELTIGGMTTPACLDLHEMLAQFYDDRATHVALEVSSHGIRQERISGVHFDSAIFTNLSRDHIDYHGDMDTYGRTKARLFTEYALNHRIISIDCEFGRQLVAQCNDGIVVTSVHPSADVGEFRHVVVSELATVDSGFNVAVSTSWGDGSFQLPLYGEFNVANAVQVLALLLAQGVSIVAACDVLQEVSAPPGRMQRIGYASAPAVFVDYAHTPAGLEAALNSLRAHCTGKLWCVFGCGGDRDQGKRPMMGQVAEKLADRVVLTNDNPRSEAPHLIIEQARSGMTTAADVIEDRAAAIAFAINGSEDDDLVLIAGKGHEQFQQLGGVRKPFSDYAIALANLSVRQVRSAGAT